MASGVRLRPPQSRGCPAFCHRAGLAIWGIVVASVTLAGGSACLAPGETALVSVSETPWAILLVGLVLAEWPSTQTAIGGTVIMAAVLWYQVTALRRGA